MRQVDQAACYSIWNRCDRDEFPGAVSVAPPRRRVERAVQLPPYAGPPFFVPEATSHMLRQDAMTRLKWVSEIAEKIGYLLTRSHRGDRNVSDYRVYCLTAAGTIELPDLIRASDDDEALHRAQALKKNARKLEIWQGSRLVARSGRAG